MLNSIFVLVERPLFRVRVYIYLKFLLRYCFIKFNLLIEEDNLVLQKLIVKFLQLNCPISINLIYRVANFIHEVLLVFNGHVPVHHV